MPETTPSEPRLFDTLIGRGTSPTDFGHYAQELAAMFLVENGEDYRIRLLDELRYTNAEGEVYTVPRGFICDGASIPSIAWPFIGAPLTGDFRRASVVHDYGCYLRIEPSWVVHSRFYYAMRADGVGAFRAGLMYLCVRFWGPQFDGLVTNTTTFQHFE